jgi:hypothetical protein
MGGTDNWDGPRNLNFVRMRRFCATIILLIAVFAGLIAPARGAVAGFARSSIAANTGVGATYEIVDGVRRSVAANMAGQTTIAAQVMAEGRIVQTLEVPISSLLSPKTEVDGSTQSSMARWLQTLQKTQAGSAPPPIIIQSGSRGTAIPSVGLDHMGGW